MVGVKNVGHRATQHAVAEELQAFVVFRAVAAVPQRLLQQRLVGEAITETGLEGGVPRRRQSPAVFAAKSM
jgi:hypothetical protein